ncbi:MAG: ATP-binding protein [Fibromonadaceae bacterium]|jgi:predicted AAA+ superfamily ATPase|nr:ATP-binding protein [Fibromonadaceae bacterium]
MQKYIKRLAEAKLHEYLKIFPAVAVLGPRQCGKSTMIKQLVQKSKNFIYLDLQSSGDLRKLQEPEFFFENNADKTVCIDEIQLAPHLFSALRSAIDSHRKPKRFILLGSASRDLIQKTSESLAGRVGFIELSPLTKSEILSEDKQNKLWLRGGFPNSYLARDNKAASIWLEQFLRTYIERDLQNFGINIPAIQIRRFLTMFAHNQAQVLNSSKLAESLGLTHPTIRRYIDLLENSFVMRTLQPFENNIKKRLIKSPKVYIRDTGILHKLLQIGSLNDLFSHPVFGFSWEGYVIENIISENQDFQFFFYRTSSGNEIDLVIETGKKRIAVECKASTAPQLSHGNYSAIEDIRADKIYVVAPVKAQYKLKENIIVANLPLEL